VPTPLGAAISWPREPLLRSGYFPTDLDFQEARNSEARLPRRLFRKGLSGPGKTISGMIQNFIAVDRDQAFLMPPSLLSRPVEN
jgi:hypothetical protein